MQEDRGILHAQLLSPQAAPHRATVNKGEYDTMNTQMQASTKGEVLLRAERTAIDGMTVDYRFLRSAEGQYSMQIDCEGRSERLQSYTDEFLLAEALYLLAKEERLLPGTLGELWQDLWAMHATQ